MLYNLIQNTAEAVSRGGILTFRLGIQYSIVGIDVADNGLSVAQHNREKVFNLFFLPSPSMVSALDCASLNRWSISIAVRYGSGRPTGTVATFAFQYP